MKSGICGELLPASVSYGVFGLIGVLFWFCWMTGHDLAAEGNILWTGGYLFRTLGISLAAGGSMGAGICCLLRRLAGVRFGQRAADMGRLWGWLCGRADGAGAKRGFGIAFCLICLSWLPGFLAYYPGICAYDMPIQMGQFMENFYIDHHPIAHTLLIQWAFTLGKSVFGTPNAGIGILVLLQMGLLGAAFASGAAFLWRRGIRRIWLVLLQLSFMLYPFHWYMSISVTKDTVFSAFFIFQVLAFLELLETGAARGGTGFLVASVGVILFRNNGRYAFLVFLAVLLFALAAGRGERRFWGKLLVRALGAFLAGNVMLWGIYRAAGAHQGDKREMLSIPIQQLARTMLYHGGAGALPEDDGTMGEAERSLIDDFLLNEAYRRYRPDFADPVKSHTNTYVARYRAKEFISVYLKLLMRYPGDFVNAFLAVDAGYLYPDDVSHAYVNAQPGQAAGGGYAQTRWDEATLNGYGIFKDTKWAWLHEKMEQWADSNAYLEVPLLKYLFVPGTWIWLYLLLLAWRLMRRESGHCVCLSLVFGYYLTLLLGPTVQLRYLYPVMAVFPFLLLAGGQGLSEEGKG